MNKKIGFVSLGCAKNLTDTETMLGILHHDGYDITSDPDGTEIIVVNTCAFIDSAKEESINAILEMAEYKKDKCELLIVTGCLAQRYSEEIEKEIPEVDIILGTSDYDKISECIDEFYKSGNKRTIVGDANNDVSHDLPRMRSTPKHTAYLKIADGCDNHCTYCIIPKLRGKYRSRSEESVLDEARSLASQGVKELILVAQDTAYYGRDLKNCSLAILVDKISKIDGIEWIRLQYCYPENITDELIDVIAGNDKVVKYLDMPLQHVSDNVLKKMGRRSRYMELCELIEKLRSRIPKLVIRTSLIVGFPGETEDDFLCLCKFLKEYKIDKVGVFTYSKEEGTPASTYDNQVDEEISIRRQSQIMELQRGVSYEINSKKLGTCVKVIIESYNDEEYCYVGRTDTDTPDVDGTAYIYSTHELNAGDIITVEIVDCAEYDIMCKTMD